MDYLPIQASAVPCERVFSSSAETDTKKHNRIKPVLMEALQMLKFSLKKQRLDFTGGWITSENEMSKKNDPIGRNDDSEPDLLANLFSLTDKGGGEDAMDEAIQTICESDQENN